MRVRVKFEKTGIMRYVGHLDMMRFFQKAVKRAELPIRYSEGFNPHQIMSFSAPLGVGLTSLGEYMDIDIKEFVPSEKGVEALNRNMVEGLNIVSFKYLPEEAEKCMSALTAAHYTVSYKNPKDDIFYVENIEELKQAFYDKASEIRVIKETKKGSREIDLKPLVYTFTMEKKDDNIFYDMLVSSGSVDNIKPELVIKSFHEFIGLPDFDENSLDICRVDMYTGPKEELVSLGDIGNEN